jgi:hypothetical protein
VIGFTEDVVVKCVLVVNIVMDELCILYMRGKMIMV